MCYADFDQEGRPLQLRDVAALLRKGDDPHSVLRGLRVIGPLIDAAPEELSHTAGEARRLACDSIGLLVSHAQQALAVTEIASGQVYDICASPHPRIGPCSSLSNMVLLVAQCFHLPCTKVLAKWSSWRLRVFLLVPDLPLRVGVVMGALTWVT